MERDEFLSIARLDEPRWFLFEEEPVEQQDDDFDALLQDLLRASSRIPGLEGLYVDRSPCVCGLGLARLLAVVDEALVDPRRPGLEKVIQTVGTRNILEPEYIPLNKELMRNLAKFDCLLSAEHVMGDQVEPNPPKQEETRYFKISRFLDMLAHGYLGTFFRAAVERRVDVEQTMLDMQSLVSVLDVVKGFLRKEVVPEWDETIEAIRNVQEVWFTEGIERYRLLMKAVKLCLATVFDVVETLDTYFIQARVVNLKIPEEAPTPNAVLAAGDAVTVYTSEWTADGALRRMMDNWQKRGEIVSVLPASLGVQLLEYSRGTNDFAKYIKSIFRAEGLDGNMERTYISWERGNLLDAYLNVANLLRVQGNRDVVLGAPFRKQSRLAAAAGMMGGKRSKARLNRVLNIFRSEEE